MDIEYLKTSIGGYLSKALAELAKKRPERPVEYLAYYLIDLHEKELQIQKAQAEKKKKSISQVKVAASISSTDQTVSSMLSEVIDQVKVAASSTDQTVSSVLSEVIDKCSDMYDPEVKDPSINVLEPSEAHIPDRRLTAPIVIDDVSYLNEDIANMVIDGNNEYTAEVQGEIPHSYELNLVSPPEDAPFLPQQVPIPGTSTNNLQIDSD